jgi:HK97 family phage portal protein
MPFFSKVRSFFTRSEIFGADDIRALQYLGSPESSTGLRINERTALKHWAVRASVNYVAGHFSALPVFPFKRSAATDYEPASKERITEGPLFNIVHDEADEWTTQTVWAQASMMNVLLHRGCFSEIEFNGAGEAVALHLLTPDRVSPKWVRAGDEDFLVYDVTPPADREGTPGRPQRFPAWQIFHVPGLTWDGVNGIPVTETGKDTIGLGRAAEISAGRVFKNGGFVSATVDIPETITDPKKIEAIKKLYQEGHEGLSNHHRAMFNFFGVKYTPQMMDGEKTQLLESRQLSSAEIASLFGLDPSLIGATPPGGASVTYANAETRQRAFYIGTLRPLCRKFKQEMQKKLVKKADKGTVCIDYMFDDMTSVDPKTFAEIQEIEIRAGILTKDEARAQKNRKPLPKEEPATPLAILPVANGAPSTGNTTPQGQSSDAQSEPVPVRALVHCKELIADTSARLLKVFTERLDKQTDDTRSAFITEQTTKIRSALLPTFNVYATLLDGDALADELLDRHVGELLKEYANG